MTNEMNLNNVANVVTEAEVIVPDEIQETIEQTVGSNGSNVTATLVGVGTAVGGYIVGKYVVEPVAKKVKNAISNWWNSMKSKKNDKNTNAEAEETEDNIVPIPEDVEQTHRIG